eukprot:gnl/TRDRNA2_/TRDRNA2_207031_c0_seq1.p1 gnl/TRDRNA2_/TRDRNA2_207031_c0~~gnl/TRDRNA2_/TRDRNA2_207031_c0_seq1.p1  ORF type:complete len:572 (-),score=80.88 gnl/TRDRNA2_/TRDRNA2_207031_c0_seq1:74-1789(-)
MAALPVMARDQMPLLLSSLVDKGARNQPDNVIVTKGSKGYMTVTFREHQSRTFRIASALSRWGLKIGDRAATLMWNTSWHLECYHALSCYGAVLHTLNLRLGPKDLGFIIENAQDRVIFVDSDLLELLASVDASILGRVELFVACGADGVSGAWSLPPQMPAARTMDFEHFMGTGDAVFAWPVVPETSLHALCYTSGTTGNPKGVAYSQRSTYLHTLMLTAADCLEIRGSMVVLPFVPMFHVLGWGLPFAQLMLGARTILTGKYMDPETLLDAFLDWKVELSCGVPTVWQGVRGAMEKRGIDKIRSGLALRLLSVGGSAPPPEMMAWYFENLGVEFIQGWGMTETNPLGCIARRSMKHKDLAASPGDLFKNITKAGLTVPCVELRIANPENLDEDMPQGEPGELLVRGPTTITEYFQVNASDKFHKGWLITGDVAKLDEENALIISDRSKDVIKSGGEWISSIDLENHIASMPEVAMAAVVAMPHPRWDERPIAIVTLNPDVGAGAMDGLTKRVSDHCLKTFAKFQLPDDFLVWEAIPLTSTGKLDKKVIRDQLKREGYVIPTARAPESKL